MTQTPNPSSEVVATAVIAANRRQTLAMQVMVIIRCVCVEELEITDNAMNELWVHTSVTK